MKNYSINNGVLSCLLILVFAFFACPNSYADKKKKKEKKETSQTEYKGDVGTTITLVTSGTGETKEEATKNALRSALEQTYGAFVSSDSKVVNDELVSDEIVSISTGNIAKYEILSFVDSSPMQVTTKAVVSISNLRSYAQNKGMSAELAGNTFAMNLKMEELNKKNEVVALNHLLEQTKIMAKNLFDYEIRVGNPGKTADSVQVPVTIKIFANDNTLTYYDYFHKTLSSLAVRKGTGDTYLSGEPGVVIDGISYKNDKEKIVYFLRSSDTYGIIEDIRSTLSRAELDCEIVDNLGYVSDFKQKGCSNKGSCRIVPFRCYRDGYGEVRYISNSTDLWMNAAKPHNGEKLYEADVLLTYTVDEISKISKIEVRPTHIPSKEEQEAIDALWNDFKKADEWFTIGRHRAQGQGNGSHESLQKAAKEYYIKASDLFKMIQSNPKCRSVPKLCDAIKEELRDMEFYIDHLDWPYRFKLY